jgi:hypothetical protein
LPARSAIAKIVAILRCQPCREARHLLEVTRKDLQHFMAASQLQLWRSEDLSAYERVCDIDLRGRDVATVNVRPAFAQGPIDSRTEFSVLPVELPASRPPGTYVFKFADATTSRKVMQVQAKSNSKTYGLFLTISAQRPKASDDAELRFMETPVGKSAAVKTWWYPGNSIGWK